MTSDHSFLFPEDQENERRKREKERRSRLYGTPEFWFAYHQYIRTSEWKRLCRQVKERARNRCERCPPSVIQLGPFQVHHLTYDRFMCELLSDLQHLCVPCHRISDREREQRNVRAYEAAGEEAREAAGMNTYFTKKLGEDWWMQFGDDPEGFYEEWDSWKQRKDEEEGY